MLCLASWARPALGHEPPAILPTRLEFDASRAPKKCNDLDSFQSILLEKVGADVLRADAERRLIVRIRFSSTGGKRADVTLVDGQGVTVAERHTPYASTTECYKVLSEVAHDAARILGAFEPPPPKRPVPGPVCPTCPPPVPSAPARAYRVYVLPTPALTRLPYRSFIGLGALVGSGIYSQLGAGPYLLLGAVPSEQWPHLHAELEASWTSQTLESGRVHSLPLVGSLCLVRDAVRFCGGLATTIFYSNQSSNDELLLHCAANLRVGTELFVHGPFAIRADVFGRLAFAQAPLNPPNPPAPFAAGMAMVGALRFK